VGVMRGQGGYANNMGEGLLSESWDSNWENKKQMRLKESGVLLRGHPHCQWRVVNGNATLWRAGCLITSPMPLLPLLMLAGRETSNTTPDSLSTGREESPPTKRIR
jgi:hypothetical protein